MHHRIDQIRTVILTLGVCLAVPGWAQDAVTSALSFDPWNTQANIQSLGTYIRPPQQFPLPHTPPLAPENRTWTLTALTNWALLHNPQTAQAWAALRASADSLGIAEGAWLPTVTLQGQYQTSQTKYYMTGIVPVDSQTTSDNLSINEVLYDFGRRQASIAQAKDAVWVAQFQADSAIQQVTQTLSQAYYNYLYAQTAESDLAQSVVDAQQLVETTRKLYESHLRPATDYNQMQVFLEGVKQQWILARGNMLSSQGSLAQAAGMSVDQILKVTQMSTPPEQIPSDIRTLLNQALKQNPNVLMNAASVKQAEAALELARAQNKPSLSVTLNSQDNIPNMGIRTRNTSVMLQVNIPIDANLTLHYQTRQQYDLLSQAIAQEQVQAASVELGVWQAFQVMQSSWQAYKTDLDQVASAKLTVYGMRARYNMGLSSILEVINAEQNLTSAKLSEALDLSNVYIYLAILYAYIGIAPTVN